MKPISQKVSRLWCGHEFYWSERRRRDVCRRCGVEADGAPTPRWRNAVSWTVGADLPPVREPEVEPDTGLTPQDDADGPMRRSDDGQMFGVVDIDPTQQDFGFGQGATLHRSLVNQS